MKATIWHNPKCGTSRKTLAILEESDGVDVEVIEYLKAPYSREKLEQLLRDSKMSAKDALRVRGSKAEELGLTADDVSEEAIISAMSQDSMLVNRPIVETDKGVRLCRPQEIVHEIL